MSMFESLITAAKAETKDTVKVGATSGNANGAKSENSLFDSILSEVKTTVTSQKEEKKETIQTPVKNTQNPTQEVAKDIETIKQTQNTNTSIVKEKLGLANEANKKPQSLMDDLISQAKKDIQNKDQTKKEEVPTQKAQEVKEQVAQKVVNEIAKENISKVVEKSVEQPKEVEAKTENKKTQEPKQTIIEQNKEEVKPKEVLTTKEKVEPKNIQENQPKEEIPKETPKVEAKENKETPQTKKEEVPTQKAQEVKEQVAQKVVNETAKENIAKVVEKSVEQPKEVEAKTEENLQLPSEEINETKVAVVNIGENTKNKEKESVETKNSEPKSLLDKLIDESLQSVEEASRKVEKTVAQLKSTVEQAQIIKEENFILTPKETAQTQEKITKEPILANMYMSVQRHIKDLASMQQKKEAKDQAANAKSVEELSSSAKKLDLNPQDAELEVVQEKVQTPTIQQNAAQNNSKFLNRLAFTKNVMHENLAQMQEITKANLEVNTEAKSEPTVQINVNPSLAQSIQSRIIGAKQQMSQMMSDIAREMVENYKPPITAFRINLNPNGLGQIAVLMRSEKDNGLTIKLNMSNNATLEALVDNQGLLRASLARTFDMQQQQFTLDFGMQESSQNEYSQQSGQSSQQQNQQQQQNNTAANSSEEIVEENTNSMQYL